MLELISLLALTVSVLVLAWKTRLSASIGAASVQGDLTTLWQGALGLLLQRPGLRKYFAEGTEVPAEGVTRDEVLLLAEVMGDAIEASLENAHELRSFGRVNLPDLERWGFRLLRDSPAILTLTAERGEAEWPRLHELGLRQGLFDGQPSSGT